MIGYDRQKHFTFFPTKVTFLFEPPKMFLDIEFFFFKGLEILELFVNF